MGFQESGLSFAQAAHPETQSHPETHSKARENQIAGVPLVIRRMSPSALPIRCFIWESSKPFRKGNRNMLMRIVARFLAPIHIARSRFPATRELDQTSFK